MNVEFPEILGAAVHDAKESLGVLLSQLEDMARETAAGSAAQRQLNDVRYEIQRINGNLVKLLTLYKIDRSEYALELELHGVRGLLDEVVLNHRVLLDARGIALSVDCADGLHGYFDFNLLAGVLGNALNNAIRYTRNRLRLAARKQDGELSIYVEDNGRGFPPAMLAHPTLQAGGACERGFIDGHTGLGLHFTAVVVAMHANGGRRGRLTLDNDSALGGGRYGVHLP